MPRMALLSSVERSTSIALTGSTESRGADTLGSDGDGGIAEETGFAGASGALTHGFRGGTVGFRRQPGFRDGSHGSHVTYGHDSAPPAEYCRIRIRCTWHRRFFINMGDMEEEGLISGEMLQNKNDGHVIRAVLMPHRYRREIVWRNSVRPTEKDVSK